MWESESERGWERKREKVGECLTVVVGVLPGNTFDDTFREGQNSVKWTKREKKPKNNAALLELLLHIRLREPRREKSRENWCRRNCCCCCCCCLSLSFHRRTEAAAPGEGSSSSVAVRGLVTVCHCSAVCLHSLSLPLQQATSTTVHFYCVARTAAKVNDDDGTAGECPSAVVSASPTKNYRSDRRWTGTSAGSLKFTLLGNRAQWGMQSFVFSLLLFLPLLLLILTGSSVGLFFLLNQTRVAPNKLFLLLSAKLKSLQRKLLK